MFRYFPDGIVMGVLNTHSGQATMNPPRDRVINADDCLVMLRPTGVSVEEYFPEEEPVDVDIGERSCASHCAVVSKQPPGASILTLCLGSCLSGCRRVEVAREVVTRGHRAMTSVWPFTCAANPGLAAINHSTATSCSHIWRMQTHSSSRIAPSTSSSKLGVCRRLGVGAEDADAIG